MALLDDLLDGVHLITRLKIKPDLSKDPTLSPRLRDVATKLAANMQISHLSRVWQMLLKAVPEVAQAGHPIQALEMALIRICFAATLPPLEDLAKRGPGTDLSAQVAMMPTPAHTPAPTAQMRVVSTNTAPRIDAVAAP